jgi:hypothetical protein
VSSYYFLAQLAAALYFALGAVFAFAVFNVPSTPSVDRRDTATENGYFDCAYFLTWPGMELFFKHRQRRYSAAAGALYLFYRNEAAASVAWTSHHCKVSVPPPFGWSVI